MTDFSFAISAGHGVSSPTSVESIITYAPHILPDQWVPYLGNNKRRMGSGASRRDGLIEREWRWDFMSVTDLNALIMAVWGNFTTASVAATIITLDETGRYARFNVYADKPHPQEDYAIVPGGVNVNDVAMPFRVIASLGEFTAEFTDSFTL